MTSDCNIVNYNFLKSKINQIDSSLKGNFMHKISNQAKLFFKKFMWNMIYLFSYKSLAYMDEDILYNEFLNEIYKSKKNDLNLKGIVNANNQKDEKDICKIAIFLTSFFAQIRKFLKFNFIDDNSFHLACNNFRFSKLPKGENLMNNRVVLKNSFVILLKGKVKAKLSKTIQYLHIHSEDLKKDDINSTHNNRSCKTNNIDRKESKTKILNTYNYDTNNLNGRVEYFEKIFSAGDYFDYNSLNKNEMSLIEFEAVFDSDIIYLNNKKYNICFLSSINNTERQRKKFILNTIESMRSLPKPRFDMFYEHVNIEIYEKNANEFVYYEGHEAQKIHIIYFGSFNLDSRNPKKITYVNDYEAQHLKMHTISKLEKGNFAGLEALDIDRTFKNTLRVTSSYGVVFSIDPGNIPTDSLYKIKDYVASIAKIKKKIYNDTIKSMEFYKNKYKIEYRADLFNKIVKDNTTYLCDNIQEKVCSYKKDNIFEPQECKNTITDKKLIYKFEHLQEKNNQELNNLNNKLQIQTPEKKKPIMCKENLESNLPSIMKKISTKRLEKKSINQNEFKQPIDDVNNNKYSVFEENQNESPNKKIFTTHSDLIKKSDNFSHKGSTAYFKFNLNKKDNTLLKKDSVQLKIFSTQRIENEKGSQCQIIDEDKDDIKQYRQNEIKTQVYDDSPKTPMKKKIEAYGSVINCINPSNLIYEKYNKIDKLHDKIKNMTTTNIKNIKSNLNNSMKNSILGRDYIKSSLIDENILLEKIPDENQDNTHSNNHYYTTSYNSGMKFKKNIRKIKNMVYKKDKEFFLSTSIRNCKEYASNEFSDFSKEKKINSKIIFNDSESDNSQISCFNKKTSSVAKKDKTNLKKFKNMRSIMFEEMINYNKQIEDKAKIKLEIGKNMQNTTHIDFKTTNDTEKKYNYLESEANRNKLLYDHKKKLIDNTSALNEKIKNLNFKKFASKKSYFNKSADKFNNTNIDKANFLNNPFKNEHYKDLEIKNKNNIPMQRSVIKVINNEKEYSSKYSKKFLIDDKNIKEKSVKLHNIKLFKSSKQKSKI